MFTNDCSYFSSVSMVLLVVMTALFSAIVTVVMLMVGFIWHSVQTVYQSGHEFASIFCGISVCLWSTL